MQGFGRRINPKSTTSNTKPLRNHVMMAMYCAPIVNISKPVINPIRLATPTFLVMVTAVRKIHVINIASVVIWPILNPPGIGGRSLLSEAMIRFNAENKPVNAKYFTFDM